MSALYRSSVLCGAAILFLLILFFYHYSRTTPGPNLTQALSKAHSAMRDPHAGPLMGLPPRYLQVPISHLRPQPLKIELMHPPGFSCRIEIDNKNKEEERMKSLESLAGMVEKSIGEDLALEESDWGELGLEGVGETVFFEVVVPSKLTEVLSSGVTPMGLVEKILMTIFQRGSHILSYPIMLAVPYVILFFRVLHHPRNFVPDSRTEREGGPCTV
ncbi:hypothetical protein BT96DRAFT_946997 [Gymnopus androsaceus JB14]|uniref:Uncharacterized protein n=1 Tax=Gymnopus androsaceus JB14 TaxID=1447944 RepID=A0A6A4GVB6_9AGAR|nr:hypothetical protein BT96DRAFT_946997 [Gymnopus androsaceus JB14]